MKTLRRKLARLAKPGAATAFGRALARRRVADRGEALGFLYVDATSASTTASGRSRRPTWRACASACRQPPTTG